MQQTAKRVSAYAWFPVFCEELFQNAIAERAIVSNSRYYRKPKLVMRTELDWLRQGIGRAATEASSSSS